MKHFIALTICFLTVSIAVHERIVFGAAGTVETLASVFSILLIPFIISDMKSVPKRRSNI